MFVYSNFELLRRNAWVDTQNIIQTSFYLKKKS